MESPIVVVIINGRKYYFKYVEVLTSVILDKYTLAASPKEQYKVTKSEPLELIISFPLNQDEHLKYIEDDIKTDNVIDGIRFVSDEYNDDDIFNDEFTIGRVIPYNSKDGVEFRLHSKKVEVYEEVEQNIIPDYLGDPFLTENIPEGFIFYFPYYRKK